MDEQSRNQSSSCPENWNLWKIHKFRGVTKMDEFSRNTKIISRKNWIVWWGSINHWRFPLEITIFLGIHPRFSSWPQTEISKKTDEFSSNMFWLMARKTEILKKFWMSFPGLPKKLKKTELPQQQGWAKSGQKMTLVFIFSWRAKSPPVLNLSVKDFKFHFLLGSDRGRTSDWTVSTGPSSVDRSRVRTVLDRQSGLNLVLLKLPFSLIHFYNLF